MEWETEQKILIRHFNAGISRILIATSVLEEGLDVQYVYLSPSNNIIIIKRFKGLAMQL